MATGYEDLGSDVSETPQATSSGGQFSATEKSYESVIIQEESPVIDWEMNLVASVGNNNGYMKSVRNQIPTCFLNGDFLENADNLGSYELYSATAGNEYKLRLKAQNVVVNGWNIRLEYTNTTSAGYNDLTFSAVPASGTRTDLVILEVWRALIKAAPSTDHKSATGLILRNGNVKAPDGVNLADDLIDPSYALESNARIQIQYRLRIIENVNLSTYADGLDDPSVVAYTTSDFGGAGADGSATVRTFAKSADDPGLWIAGNGDSTDATLFGSVDGYMYATPVCAITRRNSTAFDRATNMNGGVTIASGTSDRPDGLFYDQIVADDILDLRRGRSGEIQDILQKMTYQVFSNTLATKIETTSEGTSGTSALFRDDILSSSPGKMGITDGGRRHFSDRSVTEVIVCKVSLSIGQDTAVYSLDTGLQPAWSATALPGATGLFSLGATIKGIGKVRIVNSTSTTDQDGFDTLSTVYVESITLSVNTGPQVDTLTLVLNSTVAAATEVYVEIFVEVPGGFGTSRNVKEAYDVWAPGSLPAWVDTSLLTATTDADRTSIDSSLWSFDTSHRELSLNLQTVTQSGVTFYTVGSDELYIWERLNGDPITIDDGVNAPYATTDYTEYTDYTRVLLSGGVSIGVGNAVSVDYVALRPAPVATTAPDDSYNVFYKTSAVQSIVPGAGSLTLELIPRCISNQVYVIGSSTGSPDIVQPYGSPGEQIPVGSLPSGNYPESILDAPPDLTLSNYTADGGFVQVPMMRPIVPDFTTITLSKGALDTTTDAEGRNFWPKITSSILGYSLVIDGPDLSYARNFKVVLPMIMELTADVASIGRKGSLVLVLISGYTEFDSSTRMRMTSAAGRACAGIFRIKGRMSLPRRVDV